MFLLDTHLLVWAAYDASRLSRSATRLRQQRDARLFFSLLGVPKMPGAMVTLWLIAFYPTLSIPTHTGVYTSHK